MMQFKTKDELCEICKKNRQYCVINSQTENARYVCYSCYLKQKGVL